MTSPTQAGWRKFEHLALAAALMPFATLGAVLWVLGLSVFSRATATSFLAATVITLMSLARVMIVHRSNWKQWLLPAGVMLAILWPLGLIVLTQASHGR
jgi:hypothetical protein